MFTCHSWKHENLNALAEDWLLQGRATRGQQGFMSGGFCALTLSSACHIVNKTSKLQDDVSGVLEPFVCRCVTCTENTGKLLCFSLQGGAEIVTEERKLTLMDKSELYWLFFFLQVHVTLEAEGETSKKVKRQIMWADCIFPRWLHWSLPSRLLSSKQEMRFPQEMGLRLFSRLSRLLQEPRLTKEMEDVTLFGFMS